MHLLKKLSYVPLSNGSLNMAHQNLFIYVYSDLLNTIILTLQ